MTPYPLAWPGADLPLDPSPSEGRSWLRRELVRPEYQEGDPLQRLLAWLGRVLRDGLAVAERTPPLTLFAAMLVVLLLVLAVVWLLGRADRDGGRRRTGGAVVVDTATSAAELRRRAEAAYEQGRYGEALVDAFRAVATRQAERGELDDLPGRTAHEVAEALAAGHPEHAALVREVARGFDLVRYGDRPADRAQAGDALALDDELAGRRGRVR